MALDERADSRSSGRNAWLSIPDLYKTNLVQPQCLAANSNSCRSPKASAAIVRLPYCISFSVSTRQTSRSLILVHAIFRNLTFLIGGNPIRITNAYRISNDKSAYRQ
jgi:hypothetical protein